MNIKHQGSIRLLMASGLMASLLPAQLIAGGYKVPENSINSTALSAAYIANAHGADAAYFNPAAMVFNEEGASMEANLTYIHLRSIEYTDLDGYFPSDESEREHFYVPSFHYVSPKMGDTRFGLSVITPAGLTKQWSVTGEGAAQDFTLKTIEINPTVAYEFNERFSGAIGARMVYSDGVVKSNVADISALIGGVAAKRDLTGDSYDFGYNLALHFKPTKNLDLAITYRSEIDLTIEGEAEISHTFDTYKGDAEVEVPIPAALNLAAAYTFNDDKTTLELVYERTYWSAYEELDFDYDRALTTTGGAVSAFAFFDASRPKDWSDSNSYRIGITHKPNRMWTLMAGYAYDETPVPEDTAGFELPDSDAHIFSIGARYQYTDDMNIGFGLLYDKKDKLKIREGTSLTDTVDNSDFEEAEAILLTVGVQYTF